VVRLETFVRQPGGPTTGLAQVDGQDSPRQAFAGQQRVAIRVERTTIGEDRVGQIGPVLDRTIGADFPYITRARAKGPTRCPERAIRIEGETHRRFREIDERGGRTGRRVVAVYAIVGIEADENRPGRVDGQMNFPSDRIDLSTLPFD
jgi:hypothetical protein